MEGGVALAVRRSKMNKTAQPEFVVFAEATSGSRHHCVPSLLRDHMFAIYGDTAFARKENLLFPRQRTEVRLGTYTEFWRYEQWVAVLRWLASLTGILDPNHVAGHSPRAGGATDALRSGAPTHMVMAQGRWKSPTSLARYDRWSMVDRLVWAREIGRFTAQSENDGRRPTTGGDRDGDRIATMGFGRE